jgi:hypothetical protein
MTRRCCRPSQGLRSPDDPVWDLGSPEGKIVRDFKGDGDEFDAPEFADQSGKLGRPPAGFTDKDPLQGLALLPVGFFIDKEAHRDRRVPSPYVALKGRKGEQIQIVQLDIAKMTLPDMPCQHALAGVIRWGLGELTGAGDVTTADVEPVAGQTPLRDRCHWVSLREVEILLRSAAVSVRLDANQTANYYAMAQPDQAISYYYHPANPTMATKPATAFLSGGVTWQTVCSLPAEVARPHYAMSEGCAGWAGAEPPAQGTSHAAE